MTVKELRQQLQPETTLEASFLEEEDFVRGLQWGLPRYGHPEGNIWRHILEVNANIDRLPAEVQMKKCSPGSKRHFRESLRLISWVHDTFKNIEDKSSPRDWSRHHSVYARDFLANYIRDPQLLAVVELHDEAYYVWRLIKLMQQEAEARERLHNLQERVGDYWQLYYLFFKCDTCTGDKNPAPLIWFEQQMPGIIPVEFLPEAADISAFVPGR